MKPVKNLRHASEENESSVRDEKVFPFAAIISVAADFFVLLFV